MIAWRALFALSLYIWFIIDITIFFEVMNPLFLVAIVMGPVGWTLTIGSALAFLVMFGIASVKGDFQGLIKTTLANDAANRKKR